MLPAQGRKRAGRETRRRYKVAGPAMGVLWSQGRVLSYYYLFCCRTLTSFSAIICLYAFWAGYLDATKAFPYPAQLSAVSFSRPASHSVGTHHSTPITHPQHSSAALRQFGRPPLSLLFYLWPAKPPSSDWRFASIFSSTLYRLRTNIYCGSPPSSSPDLSRSRVLPYPPSSSAPIHLFASPPS